MVSETTTINIAWITLKTQWTGNTYSCIFTFRKIHREWEMDQVNQIDAQIHICTFIWCGYAVRPVLGIAHIQCPTLSIPSIYHTSKYYLIIFNFIIFGEQQKDSICGWCLSRMDYGVKRQDRAKPRQVSTIWT